MIQRGSSINKIRNYLIGKGINSEFIKKQLKKLMMKILIKIFFQQLNCVKRKELAQQEQKIIVHCFIKKIFLY